jgi:hypothetical protein
VLIGFLMAAAEADAVPAYARKHELRCTQCHSAWPMLNKFGRTFKENGYKLDREKAPNGNGDVVIDDGLSLPSSIPLSVRFQGRPVEKRNVDPRFRMRVAHEIELQVSGSAMHDFSYYVNFEAEDDPDWNAELADMIAGWHPNPAANVVGGWGSLTFADGYNAFTSRRLTQDRPTPVNTGFQSGYRFRDSTPFATFYGRTKGLYYSATVGTGTDDTLGADEKDYFLRAAYDLPAGMSLGAFSLTGAKALTNPTRTQNYNRVGADFQIDYRHFSANALWYRADEENTALVAQQNDAWYVQTFYAIPVKMPLVPLWRYESVESNDGRDRTEASTVAFVAYVLGNLNVSVEHMWQTKVPAGRTKGIRTSVLFMLGL